MKKKLAAYALTLIAIDAVGVASAGTGFKLNIGSLVCDGDVTGIAQQECPSGVGTCKVQCQLLNADALYNCQNPGGNTGGVGQPFTENVSFSSELVAFTDTLNGGTGSEHVSMTITDSQTINTLEPYCEQQNPNWSVATEAGICPNDDPGYLRPVMVVKSTQMLITATDTQGDVTYYNSDCQLAPIYYNQSDAALLSGAPYCPGDITYTCSNTKKLNLK